ncbi:SurA N-terminal domain-containing protein [Patescibacteria group bacterium]|nr:SurA N-terminal domain-containing protein [Patescibacteria group bacterium]
MARTTKPKVTPKIKKTQKTAALKIAPVKTFQPNFLNNLLEKFSPENIRSYRPSKNVYFVLLIAGILLLAIFKKGWFVSAMVNGQPISNLELQGRLNQQFKDQTLNQMINEKIILDEAAKNNALPSNSEVENKISEIETSVGGAQAFNNLLSQQGQNRENVKKQLTIQLSIEKLYAKDATVSAEEVNQYIETNKDNLRATDSASLQKEAEDTLKQQKLSQVFQQKFQSLRTQAKIQIF